MSRDEKGLQSPIKGLEFFIGFLPILQVSAEKPLCRGFIRRYGTFNVAEIGHFLVITPV
jgi:hypothetical protein